MQQELTAANFIGRWPASLPKIPVAVWVIALVVLGIQIVAGLGLFGYGYFRDELYYLACADHLGFGYVDHPPLSIWILALVRRLFGDSLLIIRLVPAVSGAALVLITALMTRALGGGKRAQVLAALAVGCAPVMFALNSFYSMNTLELLLWALCTYLLILLLKNGRASLWVSFGALIGVGFLNKHTMAVFACATGIGLLLTPARKYLLSKWLWLGVALAAVIAAPNIIWQVLHHYPSLEFYRNATLAKNIPTPPLAVVGAQMLVMSPASVPLWLAGIIWLLESPRARVYRPLAWVYLIQLGLLILTQSSRPDRLAGIYPMLFAAGAVAWSQWLATRRQTGKRLWRAGIIALPTVALITLPVCIPLLPPAITTRYAQATQMVPDSEQGISTALPQNLADRFGWPEMATAVANIYHALPPDEQSCACILAGNYGEAGALQHWQSVCHLPCVISGHNSYYLWGPSGATGKVLVVVGFSERDLHAAFSDVRLAGYVHSPYARENNTPIYIARKLKQPISQAWPRTKHYE